MAVALMNALNMVYERKIDGEGVTNKMVGAMETDSTNVMCTEVFKDIGKEVRTIGIKKENNSI